MNEVPNRANHPNRTGSYVTPQENTFLGNARRENSNELLNRAKMLSYNKDMPARPAKPTEMSKAAQEARMSAPTSYKGVNEMDKMHNPYGSNTPAPAKKVGKVRGMINKIRGRK